MRNPTDPYSAPSQKLCVSASLPPPPPPLPCPPLGKTKLSGSHEQHKPLPLQNDGYEFNK